MVINGVTLYSDLIINGLYDSLKTTSSVTYDINGVPVVEVKHKNALREVEFTSTNNKGWQSYDVISQLRAMEQDDAWLIEHNGVTYTVVLKEGLLIDKLFPAIPDGSENDFYKVNFKCIILEEV